MPSSTRTVRLLRNHMVCLRPGPADLAKRVPIVLTERDTDILIAVNQHRRLTTELVERAFFPEQNDKRASPSSRAYARIRQLWLWNYLERIELPISRVLGGRRSLLYTLGRRGIPHVEARLRPDAPSLQRQRLDRMDDLFIDHDLSIAAVWAGLHEAVRAGGLSGLAWRAERELRLRHARVRDPHTSHWLPFLPDAYFELGYPDGDTQCCLLELDLGTMRLARFRRKVRAFEAYLAAGHFAERFGRTDFDVWVVALSEARLRNLRRIVCEEVPTQDRRDAYLFAPFAVLAPGAISAPHWLDLDGKPTEPFDPGASEDSPEREDRVR